MPVAFPSASAVEASSATSTAMTPAYIGPDETAWPDGLRDPKPSPPQDDEQSARPGSVRASACSAHDGDDFLDPGVDRPGSAFPCFWVGVPRHSRARSPASVGDRLHPLRLVQTSGPPWFPPRPRRPTSARPRRLLSRESEPPMIPPSLSYVPHPREVNWLGSGESPAEACSVPSRGRDIDIDSGTTPRRLEPQAIEGLGETVSHVPWHVVQRG
jgi:hypothetical protein